MYDYEYTGQGPIYTKSGIYVADTYNQVVLGGHGAFVEFLSGQIPACTLHIPTNELWRTMGIASQVVYYIEYRTVDNVMVYLQKKRVDYADYVPGRWYISPKDLKDFVRKEK